MEPIVLARKLLNKMLPLIECLEDLTGEVIVDIPMIEFLGLSEMSMKWRPLFKDYCWEFRFKGLKWWMSIDFKTRKAVKGRAVKRDGIYLLIGLI